MSRLTLPERGIAVAVTTTLEGTGALTEKIAQAFAARLGYPNQQ